jgi:hypothetical protein
LPEVDEIEAFRATLAASPGARSADLEEYDFPTATYLVDAEDPARLSRALVESRDPLIERLTSTGGTIRLELPPTRPEQPVVVVPAEPAPAPPRPSRLRRRSGWLIADLAALALVVAVAIIALVIHAQSSSPQGDRTPTPAAGRLSTTPSPSALVASRLTATATARVTIATPAPTSTPRSPTPAPTASPTPTPAPGVTATPTAAPPATSSPTPQPTATPAQPPAATAIVAAMRQQGQPIGAEQAEPPSASATTAFLSAESFQDNRLPISGDPFSVINGGAVEVYASAQAAAQRLQELALIARAVPDAAEYDFQRGAVVLRLSRHLAQQDVQAYEAALAAATPGQ